MSDFGHDHLGPDHLPVREEGCGAREPLHEPLHQPPNPADLRAAPPACRECALVRGQLRDFVDGDLDAAARAAVELHVHTCRTCALALARGEHEVLRLRRAFAALAAVEGAGARPAHEFAARVRQRLVLDETSLVSREEIRRAVARSEAAAAEVGAQAAPQVKTSPARSTDWWFGRRLGSGSWLSRPGSLLVGAGVLLLSFLFALGFADGGDNHPERGGRLVLTEASNTFGGGDRRFPLAKGDGLGDHQTLWVGPNGAARADWHDASAKNQPAATLQVDGNGTMRVEDGSPVLVNGAVHIEARRDIRIPVADGSHVELGEGEYLLTAEPPPGSPDPLAGAPADLRVRIEVLRGDSAAVVRGSSPMVRVPAGSTGLYKGNSPVDIRANPNTSVESGGSIVRRPDPAGPRDALLTGHVFERSGLAAVGAEVLLSFSSRGTGSGTDRSASASVSGNGQFSLVTGAVGSAQAIDSPFAIVQVVPSPNRSGFGLTAPQAYRLNYQDGSARFAQAMVLDVTAELTTAIVDESGLRCAGVRVVPCVIDELFGTVLPWPQAQVTSDSEGRLWVPRLPVSLPPHQYLALALLHPELEATVVAVPWRGSAAAIERQPVLVAARLRAVRMHGLPSNATVQVFEEVAGLPVGAAATVHTILVDAAGTANAVRVGGGRLWLRNTSPSHPMLKELVLGERHGFPSYHPQQGVAPQPLGVAFQALQALPGTNVSIAASFRHQRFHRASASASGGGDPLVVVDALSGHAAQSAQVFATKRAVARGPAAVRFVGFTSTSGELAIDLEAGEDGLFAIGADGAIGWIDESVTTGQARRLELSANGEVLLGAELRPEPESGVAVVMIRFERASAPLPGVPWYAYRFACAAGGWKVGDLPPGEYRAVIDGHAHAIEVPSSGFVVLQ